MSYGSPILRQHVVEFISDATTGGVYTDGVRDATSTSGPWNWVTPFGVVQMSLDMVSGGAGGAGGGVTTGGAISAGGGGGGNGGTSLSGTVVVRPNTSLTITVGSAGTGGAIAAASTYGGNTLITGGILGAYTANTAGRIIAPFATGSGPSQPGASSTTTFAVGGNSGGSVESNATGLGATTAASTGTGGFNISTNSSGYTLYANAPGSGAKDYVVSQWSGVGGASGAATGGAAGGGNQYVGLAGPTNMAINIAGISGPNGGSTGSVSLGSGGSGGHSYFGLGGKGGSITASAPVTGSVGSGYGAGGGGGSGGAAGANGTPGYVRFTYWSQD